MKITKENYRSLLKIIAKSIQKVTLCKTHIFDNQYYAYKKGPKVLPQFKYLIMNYLIPGPVNTSSFLFLFV